MHPFATAALALPRPTVSLSDRVLDGIFRRDTEHGWRNFHQRYPGAGFLLSFSPVAFNADRQHALV